MRDGMKGNPEESLQRALAEFADETSLGIASERVRLRLRREVRGKAYRRWAIAGLAAAAALAAIVFGVTMRVGSPLPPASPPLVAKGGTPSTSAMPPAPSVVLAPPESELAAGMRAASPSTPASFRRNKSTRPAAATGEWRKGDVVLTPWFFNTALPPAARSVAGSGTPPSPPPGLAAGEISGGAAPTPPPW